MDVRCYAQRLLNPFRGSANYIRFATAEAVTLDGVIWDIYVANDELLEGLDTNSRVVTNDVRYGRWSEQSGLQRGPIFPSDDFQRLELMGSVVYESLLNLRQKVPFPYTDQIELWLLDRDDRPLALIHSVSNECDIEPNHPVDWRAGIACRRSFSSEVMQEITRDANGISAGEYLTNYINQCAGEIPVAQWIRRSTDGSGEGLTMDARPDLSGRALNNEQFPGLLLDNEHHDPCHRQLINDFFLWQSPWLLSLESLDDELRAEFEARAKSLAMIVEQQHRLYPRVIDESAIRAARVEAMIRKNQPVSEIETDTMLPFYIEMGATGG